MVFSADLLRNLRAARARVLSGGRKKRARAAFALTGAAFLFSLWYGDEVTAAARRQLKSINLGGGECAWVPAIQYTDAGFPTDAVLEKTIIAGYPSGDKRMAFLQLEGLTGLSARDEWEFMFLGATNQPFIKANYPHHEGIWGWGDIADQVVLIVSDISKVMIEYHDILWDIGYAQTFEEAYERMANLYTETTMIAEGQDPTGVDENAPVADFLVWRDLRVFDEIHWYSWFLDYYMESGLMRDMFNHELTVPSQWFIATLPNFFTKFEMRHGRFVEEGEDVVNSFDPMCATVTRGCYPVLVIDPAKLVDPILGANESRKLAQLVNGSTGFEDWMIEEEAWECIWRELIVERKGIPTFRDKDMNYTSYYYSLEMRNEMWVQINYIITKYENRTDQVATDLIDILRGHRDNLGAGYEGVIPFAPLTYEELLGYHLQFPPFFPNQKPFESDDDFFVNVHEMFLNDTAQAVKSIIDRRREWFEEEMELKRQRKVDVKYYDATGWTTLPPAGLASLTPYDEDSTYTIRYRRTQDTFAGSGRSENVAALFTGDLRTDTRTETQLCVTSVDGAKLTLDGVLKINNDGIHASSRVCANVDTGVHELELEYFNVGGNPQLLLEFDGGHGARVVPARAWAGDRDRGGRGGGGRGSGGGGGRNLNLDLMRLNEFVEEDLRNLKETDVMGPWTRAEFNRRKAAAAGPTDIQQQEPRKYSFAVLDKMLSEKMKEKGMSGM